MSPRLVCRFPPRPVSPGMDLQPGPGNGATKVTTSKGMVLRRQMLLTGRAPHSWLRAAHMRLDTCKELSTSNRWLSLSRSPGPICRTSLAPTVANQPAVEVCNRIAEDKIERQLPADHEHLDETIRKFEGHVTSPRLDRCATGTTRGPGPGTSRQRACCSVPPKPHARSPIPPAEPAATKRSWSSRGTLICPDAKCN